MDYRTFLYMALFVPILCLFSIDHAGARDKSSDNKPVKTIRIGYQKEGILVIAQQQRRLEDALDKKNINVEWVDFQSGPPLLDALNDGLIDYGTTGDAPPIFAQAAGAKIVYVAAQESSGAGEGILVHSDSKIDKLADLRGKKIAFVKGSSAHTLLIAALAKGGVNYSEIMPVYLSLTEGAAAFANHSIDAWVVWDPYFAVTEKLPNSRVLTTSQGLTLENDFFLTRADFLKSNPDLVILINNILADAAKWAANHRDEAAQILSDATGIDIKTQTKMVYRTNYAVGPIRPAVIAEQQHTADNYKKLGLIAKKVKVKDIVWVWPK